MVNQGDHNFNLLHDCLPRLHDEKAEIQKQKEYFAKLRTEFQPDGGKVRHVKESQSVNHIFLLTHRMITAIMKEYQVCYSNSRAM